MSLTAEQISQIEQVAMQIISGIVAAAPVIQQDISASWPYMQAIVDMAKAGGVPSADLQAAVTAQLDAGSAILQQKADAAQQQIDSAGPGP